MRVIRFGGNSAGVLINAASTVRKAAVAISAPWKSSELIPYGAASLKDEGIETNAKGDLSRF